MKAKKWIIAQPLLKNPLKEEDLKLVEFDLPDELQPGEVLCQAVYLSVDGYMRHYTRLMTIGDVMPGEQVCEVIDSKNGKYPKGSLLMSQAGWQSHFISKGENIEPIRFDRGTSSPSYLLGTLGMPGATAYMALNKCEPKPNEIIAISAAAGAVGHVVGQLAHLKGLTVIGFAGSEEKVKWLKDELKFDHVINYKTTNFSKALKEISPEGVDIYFDNVGGDFYTTMVSNHMKPEGRVLICGAMAAFDSTGPMKNYEIDLRVVENEITVRSFNIFKHYPDWPAALVELNKLIQEGKVKLREQVYIGIESMQDAFYGLYKGDNIGKAVIKAVNKTTNYP